MIATLFLSQSYLSYTTTNQVFPWKAQVLQTSATWVLWAAFFPIILGLAKRFRFEPGAVLKSVMFHIAAGACIAFLHMLIQIPVTAWWLGNEEDLHPIRGLLEGRYSATLLWRFAVYQVILTLCLALDYHQTAQDTEIQSSGIEAGILRAQVESLKMQIEPGFVFKSLERLKRLMHQNLDEADTLVARLGDYLRSRLDNAKNSEVTLREEIESVRRYLEIENVTRHTPVTIELDVAPGPAACSVPGSILQAAVEDLVHEKDAGAPVDLKVSARTREGSLTLIVRDARPGAAGSESRLLDLVDRLNSLYDPGIRTHRCSDATGRTTQIEIPIVLWRRSADSLALLEPSEDDRDPRYPSHPARKWLAIAGIFTFLTGYFTVQSMMLAASRGRPMDWPSHLLNCTAWYLWALLTPVVLHVSARYPLGRKRFIQPLAIHLFTLFVCYVLVCVGLGGLRWASGLAEDSFLGLFWAAIYRSPFSIDVICYVTIVAVERASRSYRRIESERIRTTRLSAQLARARLNALRMQLHPHFLFNALNSLSELMQEEPAAAEEMITNLEQFLRLTLNNGQAQEIPFEEELKFLQYYLAIEHIRFQDRLKITMDIEPQAMKVPVPNLMLQPIVENAIKHGVAPRTSPGEIEIRARRINGMLEVRVRDNGPGLSKSTRKRMGPGSGLGLNNTRERLAQLYGDSHGFELINAPEGGLIVTVQIPAGAHQAGGAAVKAG